MLKKIIDSLREELAPLVRAELRASLESPVRQELRQELLAAGLHATAETATDSSLEHRLAILSEQSSKQVSEVVRECSARQLASLTLGLEQITKEIGEGLKTFSKQETEPPSAPSLEPYLLANPGDALSAKMEQSMDLRLAKLRVSLREELEPRIRQELEPQLRAELQEEVEAEKRRLIEAATNQRLVEYLLEKNWEGMGALIEGLPPRIRLEAKSVLREILKPEVRELMLEELRGEVRADASHPIRRKIEDELRRDAKLREVVAASLKSELVIPIRKELQESLEPEVREVLENQMLMPVLLGADGNLEGTVAGVLRKNLAVCVNDMRETILDEIWELATTAILESLGASAFPSDAEGEPLLESAIQAATEIFKPKGADATLNLSLAVTAAVNVIDPGRSEGAEERWWRFARMAQELIDDRLLPRSFKVSRKLGIPEGFFRAVKAHTCDATKAVIQPGDFYVVARGVCVALPLTQETAEELVRRSAANDIPPDDDALEPPWSGIPFRS